MAGKKFFDVFADLIKINQNVTFVFLFGEFFGNVASPDTSGSVNQQSRSLSVPLLPVYKLVINLSFHDIFSIQNHGFKIFQAVKYHGFKISQAVKYHGFKIFELSCEQRMAYLQI